MAQTHEEYPETQEPVPGPTRGTAPPYRIPLGTSGEAIELHPKALGFGLLTLDGEPLSGEGSLLSRRFTVQGSDGVAYEVECKPHLLGGLPIVQVNGTRQKYGPALIWAYPLAGLALVPVFLGVVACLGWLALPQVGPGHLWMALIATVGPFLGGLLILYGTPRLLRTLKPMNRILIGLLFVLLIVVLALIGVGVLFAGALFSNM